MFHEHSDHNNDKELHNPVSTVYHMTFFALHDPYYDCYSVYLLYIILYKMLELRHALGFCFV